MKQKDLEIITPDWVSESVVYQVFPDRFRRSKDVDTQKGLLFNAWGTDPRKQGFHGGDLYGVIESLDYLQGLGVTCLYLTPIFSSAANHRYHTYDYFSVDPLLGGNKALVDLIDSLHRRGMRILLDGVFNHCGRGFWGFHHLIENGRNSPYREWFHVHKWPINPYPKTGEECGYSCWWNDPALPKFNHTNKTVRDYLISVASYWLEHGIDGWRLDVPNEVESDFWVEFRQEVKSINPQAWIVGEIWGDARPWLKGKHFDGVMNYRIGWSSLCWVAEGRLNNSYHNPAYPINCLGSKEFVEIIKTTIGWYSPSVIRSQLNLLDSHDVPRALNTLKGDVDALKLALLILFLQPGAPCIYYGTEVGLSGGIEPSCREDFPWDQDWSHDLRGYIQSLCLLRKRFTGFCKNGLEWETFGEDGLIGKSIQETSLGMPKDVSIHVWINRSRKSCLKINQESSKYLKLVGSFQLHDCELGPQSSVLFLPTA